MHTIKPLDSEAVLKAAEETRAIVTVEEHNVIGGLGGAVAEVLVESPIRKIPVKRIGIEDFFCTCDGSHDFLKSRCGLQPEKIVETVEACLSQK
jgi:transketolase